MKTEQTMKKLVAEKTNVLNSKYIGGTKYVFEIYRDISGTYYANARVGKERFFIHKWCHSFRTKKALIENIDSFCG